MKFVLTQVALFICGAFVIVHSAPSSSAMESAPKRADASSYVRFGKRNSDSDDFFSNLIEVSKYSWSFIRIVRLNLKNDIQ